MVIRLLTPLKSDESPIPAKGKLSIRRNRWGNWWGYVGTRRFKEIGSNEYDADEWLKTAEASRH